MKHYSNRKKIAIVLVVLTTFAIGSIFAFAKGGERFHRGFGMDGFPPAELIERVSAELGLSEEQKTQAQAIAEDAKQRIKPLMEKLKQNRETSKNLGIDGNFDETKVNELANEQSETVKQLFIEKEKTKAQLFAILNDEQKENAKGMMEKFGQRMKGRFHKSGAKGGNLQE